jgi:thiol-disulfide isomerase/thioredoxin
MPRLARLFLAALLIAVAGAAARAEDAAAPASATAPPPARVVSFEDEDQLAALAEKGTTVVFFYASWCPDCRATVTELNERWNDVRSGITLVIADYDREQALKQKFGITYQDTFVLLDRDGKAADIWNGGGVDALNTHTSL